MIDLRPTVLAVYGTVFVFAVWRFGIPTDRLWVFAWLLGAATITTWGSARRTAQLFRDWVPLLLLLFVYDLSRGAADSIGMPVQTLLPIRFDQAIFGSLPTVTLQRRLLQPTIQWWEVVVALVYVSHFMVPVAVGMSLWCRDRLRWIQWRRRFAAITAAALVTFFVLPTAPPWLASRRGIIEPVHRVVARGFDLIGLHAARRLLDIGRLSTNFVAAVPSLHAAYALLTAITLWPSRVARPLLVAYPLAMAFSLIYGGEHYVFDVVVGFAYTALLCVGLAWRAGLAPSRDVDRLAAVR